MNVGQTKRSRGVLAVTLLICASAAWAQPQASNEPDSSAARIAHAFNRAITATIIADKLSPPVAARLFAYANLAAYEASRHAEPSRASIAGKLNVGSTVPAPDSNCAHDWRVAAMAAYRKVALEGFFRVSIIDSLYQELIGELERTGLTFGVRECSERYGVAVGASVIEGMRSDGLATLPADSGYVPPVGPSYWMPAPPFFERPENPYWGRIRPLALDSVRQIKVMPPLAFSADTTSAMARAAIELIDSTREPDPDRVHAAVFWLDMPVPTMRGDPMRKSRPSMSPPAHWISIANTALVHAGSSLATALEVYALTSIAMHDAAVVTWAEKYRLNLLRPMQYVNTVLMREWMAGIPNPPTPEFPSDRAALAGAASTVLTAYLGDHALVDSTEASYGLGVRSFKSVTDAAREAAASGYYGGIQFRQSGDAGLALGRDVARAALQRLQPRVTRSPAKNGRRR